MVGAGYANIYLGVLYVSRLFFNKKSIFGTFYSLH
jgi:hypothetical protein